MSEVKVHVFFIDKDNMKILINIFILSHLSFALEVIELNQGDCWIKEQSSSKVKLSSFHEEKSYKIDKNKLNLLITYLKDNKISSSNILEIKSFIHCSSLGVQFVFNIKTNTNRYCVWSKYSGQKFLFKSLDFAVSNSFCDGISRENLIISLSDEASIEDLMLFLEDHNIIASKTSTIFQDKIFSLSFQKNNINILEIQSLIKKSRFVKYAEFSFYQRPIGDYSQLNNFYYQK